MDSRGNTDRVPGIRILQPVKHRNEIQKKHTSFQSSCKAARRRFDNTIALLAVQYSSAMKSEHLLTALDTAGHAADPTFEKNPWPMPF